jgi:hypothetical protein
MEQRVTPWPCPYCDLTFATRKDIQLHLQSNKVFSFISLTAVRSAYSSSKVSFNFSPNLASCFVRQAVKGPASPDRRRYRRTQQIGARRSTSLIQQTYQIRRRNICGALILRVWESLRSVKGTICFAITSLVSYSASHLCTDMLTPHRCFLRCSLRLWKYLQPCRLSRKTPYEMPIFQS